MKCNLNFENVMPSANPGVTDYSYGDSVLVKCSPQYEFNEFHRSTLLLTCLSTGQWDIQPTCRSKYEFIKSISISQSQSSSQTTGHGCSKLTTSLVNVSLKFQM